MCLRQTRNPFRNWRNGTSRAGRCTCPSRRMVFPFRLSRRGKPLRRAPLFHSLPLTLPSPPCRQGEERIGETREPSCAFVSFSRPVPPCHASPVASACPIRFLAEIRFRKNRDGCLPEPIINRSGGAILARPGKARGPGEDRR